MMKSRRRRDEAQGEWQDESRETTDAGRIKLRALATREIPKKGIPIQTDGEQQTHGQPI